MSDEFNLSDDEFEIDDGFKIADETKGRGGMKSWTAFKHYCLLKGVNIKQEKIWRPRWEAFLAGWMGEAEAIKELIQNTTINS